MSSTSTADGNHVRIRFTVDKSSSSDFSDGSMGYSSLMESNFESEMFIAQDLVATQINPADPNVETPEFPGAVKIDMKGTKNIKSLIVKNKSTTGTVRVVWTVEEDASGNPIDPENVDQFGQSSIPPGRYLVLADMQDDSVLAVEGQGEDVPVEIIVFGE
jgi:hypothetical protein